ncbi:MAG: phosphate starvation-inducible protein PhoH, partial [Chitinophagaceae bacterium]|nr:phosphate starvation-inducible protein PhoH [Chitinophagaceae bacterium]
MTEHIINLETVNPMEFFGVNNQKFDILKKRFPLLKLLSRGSLVKISGKPEDVESAREKIGVIVQYLERHGHISEQYFSKLLGDEDGQIDEKLSEDAGGDIIVFGQNGKVIRAKTANQKLLVQAAEKNDIIFAVGPAGTGKTYT